MNKLRAAEQLRRVLQMFAATLPETQAVEVAAAYDPWRPGRAYQAGEYLTYGEDANGGPRLYKVVQSHTSQADWPPDGTPALYAPLGLDKAGYPIWRPPAGAHDAYNIGDVVRHEGGLWRSKIDGNTTEPGSDERWWEPYEKPMGGG